MTSFDDAVSAVKHHSAAFQSVLRSWPAYLGDGEGNVVGSQVNYYHCRYPTPESPAIEVYANGCPPNDGQKVMIGNTADQPNLIQIVSWNDSALDDTVNDHVKNHADQHFYLGGDTVWVDWRQITTFRVQPYSGLTVYVEGGVLPRSGADLQVLPQIVDLTASVPGSSGQARYALLSIDTTGAVVVTNGTTVSPAFVLDASDVPSTPAGNFRLAAVALQYGQTLVTESLLQRDILDLRWPPESITGTGVITPGQIANASAQYKYLVSGATPFAYAESVGALNIASGKTLTASNSITLTGTDGGTTALAVTSGKTLTLTAADNYNVTIPATGTVALLQVANTYTVGPQTINTGADANKGLIVKANSATQSGVLTDWQTSAGGSVSSVDFTGRWGIGTAAINTARIVNAAYSFDGSNALNIGYAVIANITPADNSANSTRGIYFAGKVGGTKNYGTVYGGYYEAGLNTTGAGGILSNATAQYSAIISQGAGSGTITNSYGNYIATPTRQGTQTIGTNYGVYLSDQLAAHISTAYGLYTNSGLNRFGDQLSIVGSADRQQFIVTGHTTQAVATPLVQFTRNDAAAGVSAMLGLTALGSGADGDGGSILLAGKSDTTAATSMGALKWLWASATHASRKAKIQIATYDTAERIGLAIEADGAAQDVYFEGGAGSGFPYGGCYGNDINWTQASAAQDTWYIVSDADMTDSSGGLNLVTHDGNGKLTVTKAGRYRVTYGATVGCSVANKLIQTTIAVNGTPVNDGIQHVIMGVTANVVSASTAILALTASQYVEFAIRTTDTGTPDISVEHLNITLVQVGG